MYIHIHTRARIGSVIILGNLFCSKSVLHKYSPTVKILTRWLSFRPYSTYVLALKCSVQFRQLASTRHYTPLYSQRSKNRVQTLRHLRYSINLITMESTHKYGILKSSLVAALSSCIKYCRQRQARGVGQCSILHTHLQ